MLLATQPLAHASRPPYTVYRRMNRGIYVAARWVDKEGGANDWFNDEASKEP
jgi:hypothetical protein